MSDTADFFRGCIDQMIDLRHPLAVLGARMPWQEIEASLARQFARQVRAGKRVEGGGLCARPGTGSGERQLPPQGLQLRHRHGTCHRRGWSASGTATTRS